MPQYKKYGAGGGIKQMLREKCEMQSFSLFAPACLLIIAHCQNYAMTILHKYLKI